MTKSVKVNSELCDPWCMEMAQKVLGDEFELIEDAQDYDYLICDVRYLFVPFADLIKKIKPGVVSIFLTGEAICPDFNLFDYAIAFDDMKFGDRSIDVKYWQDAFAELVKPKENTAALLAQKKGFCNFIYSNPLAHPNRDMFFHKLSEYKKVDSYGKHLNNMNVDATRDNQNWNGLSVDIKAQYKFSIAFENAAHRGYTTEKIVTSMKAGTIPIYWGDVNVGCYLNNKSFINCSDYDSWDAVVAKVKELDNDDKAWCEMMAEPWMTAKQVEDYQHKVDKAQEMFRCIFRQEKSAALRKGCGTWNDSYRDILSAYKQEKTAVKKYKFLGLPLLKIKKDIKGKKIYLCGLKVWEKACA